jgi:hypothetical protein
MRLTTERTVGNHHCTPDVDTSSGAILVGNFGDAGLIMAFDNAPGKFIDHLRGERNNQVAIEILWALTFRNGSSLGDSNTLYAAADPKDEVDGVFGSLCIPKRLRTTYRQNDSLNGAK